MYTTQLINIIFYILFLNIIDLDKLNLKKNGYFLSIGALYNKITITYVVIIIYLTHQLFIF